MADPDESDVVRRVVLAYAADLLVTITVVLACGRLLMPWPGNMLDSPLVSNDFLATIGRFTPFGLWQVYQDTLLDSLKNFTHGAIASGPLVSLVLGLRTLMVFLMAAPEALMAAYAQSDAGQAWATVAAAALTATAFGLLLSGGRPSLARLLLAAMLAPALASVGFWLMQRMLLDAMVGLAWFVRMAPWCLPCPVFCTLWWVCFPRAAHGATGTLLLYLQQRWAARTQRPVIRTSPVGSRPH